jgi:Trk K+ transport system NAD-binding subunit
MFVIIVGAGKVGLNVARSLTHMGHEFIVIEQRRSRHDLLRPELEEIGRAHV